MTAALVGIALLGAGPTIWYLWLFLPGLFLNLIAAFLFLLAPVCARWPVVPMRALIVASITTALGVFAQYAFGTAVFAASVLQLITAALTVVVERRRLQH